TFHVLHVAGGFYLDAPRIETNAFADEGQRRCSPLAALPPHDNPAAFMLGPLPYPQPRIHSELLPLLYIQDVHRHTQLSPPHGTPCEFLRIEHIGRFVDEITRDHHAVCYSGAGGERLLRSRNARHRNLDPDLCCFLLVVLALGLVTLKGIGTQLHTQCHVSSALRPKRAAGQIGDDSGLARPPRDLAHGGTAQFDEVLDLEIACLADAKDDKTRRVEARRGNQVERRAVLAFEPLGRRRPLREITAWGEETARDRPEFEPLFAEQDKNAL